MENKTCSCGENCNCGSSHRCSGKIVLAIIGAILLAGVITVAILRDRIVSQQYRQVTVTGQGKIAYQPDLALVTLGAQVDKAPKAEDALSQLNTKMDAIIKAAKAEGVAEEDIQTQNYSLYPQIDYGQNNIASTTGYNANQQVTIKVRDFDQDALRLNKVIAAASKAGANQINSLSFDSSKMNDLKQQARVMAIKDAQEKSGVLAAAAGVQVRDIAGWYENLIQPQQFNIYGMGGMDAKGTPQLPSGSREVIIEVSINYNLK